MSANEHYEFVTRWQFAAPLERVWDELIHPEAWPTWWRGVLEVTPVKPGIDSHGMGAARHYTWQSRLPYKLTFTMTTTLIQPFSKIEGVATGELQGIGCWHLSHENGLTHVRYDWRVEANKWWMRWLSPIARPVFEWNHDVVMEWGRQGLVKRLADA